MTELSTLPGGDRLIALAKAVDGRPQDIRNIVTDWREAADLTSEHAGKLGASVRGVDAAWQGRSADAFNTYMLGYGKAADGLHDLLDECALALSTVADALVDAKQEVDRLCLQAVTQADEYTAAYQKAHGGASPPPTDLGVSNLVEQNITSAKLEVEKVDAAMTAAQGLVVKLGEDYRSKPQTFAKIEAATTRDFVPRDKHTVDWRRTVGYKPGDGVNLASYRPSGNGSFGGFGPSGPPPAAGGGPAPTGQIKDWIEQALQILKGQGYDMSKMNASDIWMIIRHESGGNPHAINNWDSNAAAGTPSKGLMQTIDPTFSRWALAGHKDIWNPVDNIIAGVRYAVERYGSVSAVPGVVGMKTGSGYRGY